MSYEHIRSMIACWTKWQDSGMLYNRELTLAPDLTFPSVRSIVAKSSAIWEQGRCFVANGWSEPDGC